MRTSQRAHTAFGSTVTSESSEPLLVLWVEEQLGSASRQALALAIPMWHQLEPATTAAVAFVPPVEGRDNYSASIRIEPTGLLSCSRCVTESAHRVRKTLLSVRGIEVIQTADLGIDRSGAIVQRVTVICPQVVETMGKTGGKAWEYHSA